KNACGRRLCKGRGGHGVQEVATGTTGGDGGQKRTRRSRCKWSPSSCAIQDPGRTAPAHFATKRGTLRQPLKFAIFRRVQETEQRRLQAVPTHSSNRPTTGRLERMLEPYVPAPWD